MFKNLLLVGLLAGVLSGSLLTLLQAFTVIPVIHQAEQYEDLLPVSQGEEDAHGHIDGEGKDWKPNEGWERLGFTWLANVAIGSGFGLMMAGLMSLHRPKTWGQAILFGLAGYYVFFLAPAFLLPPELPGSDSPHLEARQAIWILTVAVSLIGIALSSFTTNPWLSLLGLVGLVAPFMLFGQQDVHSLAPVPLDLIERFTWLTFLTNAIHWLTVSASSYWLSMKSNNKLTKYT
jgi:cobalt transporter subunit CbtA